jgi:hypothetical protein
MKRLMLTLLAAAGLSVGFAAVATAKTKTYDDPKKDNKCCGKSLDFVKASSASSGSTLKHKVKMRGKTKSNPPPLLNISTDKKKDCEFFVGGLVGDAAVTSCDTGQEASAQISKAGKKGFKFVFSSESIGSPNKYRWQFVYSGEYEGGAIDKAPNKPKKAKT